MYIGKMVKNELKSEKGCSGSPFSYVLRFHNLFLYISNFIDIFTVVQKIISWKAGETEVICCNAALYSRRKKHFIFDSINTITAPSFR